ncbi:MAG: RlmE family RNA methyltransferase [Burkholderiales bacterium]|nr:RlmE family RNA methyltransferase [Pseudomonadota bacterium]
MPLKPSSKAWMQRHINDAYVQRAQREGYRSRSAYKLLEINERDKLLLPGKAVLDLGAAPGGWSQVASALIRPRGKVIAVDLVPMEPLPHVSFFQGDFTDMSTQGRLRGQLPATGIDLVICDMAPNMSGIASADQARIFNLAEEALEFTKQVLKPDGAFLVKVFQGADFEAFRQALFGTFLKVAARKPKASREESRELFLLGRGLRPN